MANQLYNKGRQKFLEGNIEWLTDDIKCVLVDTDDYTLDIANDEFLSDIIAGGRVATSSNFTGKSSTNGTADAADITFIAVTGDQSEALVIYKDTGLDTTSPLIAFMDTATGLPITPDGNNINVVWAGLPNRIFTL